MPLITSELVCSSASEVLQRTKAIVVQAVQPATDLAEEFKGAVAMLQFSGAETGTLVMLCSRPLARALAAATFGLSIHELGEKLVAEALGELVNQVAGALSRHIAGAGQLTLTVPTTASGDVVRLRIVQSVAAVGADVTTMGGTVHFRYCEQAAQSSACRAWLEGARR